MEDQLRSASNDKCLIIAVHHPPYSLDKVHGGYSDIGNALDRAVRVTGRTPKAVFSGHVHSYQRFNRAVGQDQLPYVVAGAGGYAHTEKAMHKLQTHPNHSPIHTPFDTTVQGLTLQSYNDVSPGFLRITITARKLTGEYFLVPFAGDPPAEPFDTFTLNWR